MSDVIIDLEEIDYIQSRRLRINRMDLGEAIFMRNGIIIDVPKSKREDFEFTGLNNIDFYTSGYMFAKPD